MLKIKLIILILIGTIVTDAKISYPYIATQTRASQILDHWKQIQVKMTSAEVTKLLGEPDETLQLFEPLAKKPKVIGKTLWFIIQRLSEKGSQSEKSEKVVRVSFDLHDRVTSVDHWGF